MGGGEEGARGGGAEGGDVRRRGGETPSSRGGLQAEEGQDQRERKGIVVIGGKCSLKHSLVNVAWE